MPENRQQRQVGRYKCSTCGHNNFKSYDGYCTNVDCFCHCSSQHVEPERKTPVRKGGKNA